jgi:hypothetical protein
LVRRPVPVALELPAIDDVADQVKCVAGIGSEKAGQDLGFAAARAEMDVGNEYGSVLVADGAGGWAGRLRSTSLRQPQELQHMPIAHSHRSFPCESFAMFSVPPERELLFADAQQCCDSAGPDSSPYNNGSQIPQCTTQQRILPKTWANVKTL